MCDFVIEGGHRLHGNMKIQGAKNSALPILASCVVSPGVYEISDCPRLSDVDATCRILMHLGCKVKREENTVLVDSMGVNRFDIPDSLMREMRSSVIFLGAVAARMGAAVMSAPGGCEIGLRPIDLHLDGLRRMGAEITEEKGKLTLSCDGRLHGTSVTLSFPSVGATENILIAAVTAKGTTTVSNAAQEPEIIDLSDFLNRCGAKISGAGTGNITVEGVDRLYAAPHSVMPDRIVTATILAACAITGGEITVYPVVPSHNTAVISVLEQMGCDMEIADGILHMQAHDTLYNVPVIRTMPHPGFPTDAQAPLTALCCRAKGTGVVIETIFESRFRHVGELCCMGADIRVDGRMAVIKGGMHLHGANVTAPDLRGGAALVLAGLAADGTTTVSEIRHIDRGYENMEVSLSELGAVIRRNVYGTQRNTEKHGNRGTDFAK